MNLSCARAAGGASAERPASARPSAARRGERSQCRFECPCQFSFEKQLRRGRRQRRRRRSASVGRSATHRAAFEVDHARGQALGLAEVVGAHHERHAVGGEAGEQRLDLALGASGRGSRWARRGTAPPAAAPRRAPARGAAAGRPTARAPAAAPARPGRRAAAPASARSRALARAARRPATARARRLLQHRQAQHEGPLEHHRLRAAPASQPPRARRDGGSRPCSARSSVVLPEPLAPTSAMNSPRAHAAASTRAAAPAPSPKRNRRPPRSAVSSGASDGRRSSHPRQRRAVAALQPGRCSSVEHAAPRASSTMPSASASGRSPLLVSSAMAVVITRVTPSMLPPTIITAPTSAIARPKAASSTVSSAQRLVPASAARRCSGRAPSERSWSPPSRSASPTSWRVSAATIGSTRIVCAITIAVGVNRMPQRAERPAARQQQVDHQPDHHRRQRQQRVQQPAAPRAGRESAPPPARRPAQPEAGGAAGRPLPLTAQRQRRRCAAGRGRHGRSVRTAVRNSARRRSSDGSLILARILDAATRCRDDMNRHA